MPGRKKNSTLLVEDDRGKRGRGKRGLISAASRLRAAGEGEGVKKRNISSEKGTSPILRRGKNAGGGRGSAGLWEKPAEEVVRVSPLLRQGRNEILGFS